MYPERLHSICLYGLYPIWAAGFDSEDDDEEEEDEEEEEDGGTGTGIQRSSILMRMEEEGT